MESTKGMTITGEAMALVQADTEHCLSSFRATGARRMHIGGENFGGMFFGYDRGYRVVFVVTGPEEKIKEKVLVNMRSMEILGWGRR